MACAGTLCFRNRKTSLIERKVPLAAYSFDWQSGCDRTRCRPLGSLFLLVVHFHFVIHLHLIVHFHFIFAHAGLALGRLFHFVFCHPPSSSFIFPPFSPSVMTPFSAAGMLGENVKVPLIKNMA